ncbi:hypothetical protein EI74_0049 [Mycoplasma testudineum]|uniref:Uncharacterized protein n=1 Tax=Mycoplasma testudineum TaxID=244584 RepID=A0A4R6IJB5_9MOLU|nr:hypothetical protein [Mycoplasma testudineum]OYD26429.1 hypothetical protein CG473_04045 [Mycoplasma testudineum]TDO22104.1 hypothetical protein EI74_0049 [Mycoplasma testudineum]
MQNKWSKEYLNKLTLKMKIGLSIYFVSFWSLILFIVSLIIFYFSYMQPRSINISHYGVIVAVIVAIIIFIMSIFLGYKISQEIKRISEDENNTPIETKFIKTISESMIQISKSIYSFKKIVEAFKIIKEFKNNYFLQ